MNTLKEQSFKTRCIAKALAVVMIVGCLPMTSALGLETESENNKETETVLTYKDSDEGRTLGEFITNEKTDEAWKESFTQFEKELSENGYQNVNEAFDTNNMVYVGGENDEKIAVYLKDGEQENIPLSEYDGKGGEHYLWRYCKAEKDAKTESDKTETEVDYFWVRTNKMVDLKKWDADSSKEIQNETDTVENTTLDETEPLTNGTLQNVFIGGDKASDNNDGAGVETPVATYGKAKELLAPDGTIWVLGMIKVTESTTFEGANLKRWVEGSVEGQNKETYSGYLIEVDKKNVTLTLQNIVIDGGSTSENIVEQEGALIHNTGQSSVVLNAGAVLQNNYANKDQTTSAVAGAIVVGKPRNANAGTVGKECIIVNEGAVVKGNHGVRAGAFSINCRGNITINGGTVENNNAEMAGAIYAEGYENDTTSYSHKTIVKIAQGDISNNVGKTAGGIVTFNADIVIDGGKMHHNKATGNGKMPGTYYSPTSEETRLEYENYLTSGFIVSKNRGRDFQCYVDVNGGEIYENEATTKDQLGIGNFEFKRRGSVAGAILADGESGDVAVNWGRHVRIRVTGGSIHDNKAGGPTGEWKVGGVVLGGAYGAQLDLSGKPQIYNNYLEDFNEDLGEFKTTDKVCNVLKLSPKVGESEILFFGHLEEGSYVGVTCSDQDTNGYWVADGRAYDIFSNKYFIANNQDLKAMHNDRKTNGLSNFSIGFKYDTGSKNCWMVLGGVRNVEEVSSKCPVVLDLTAETLTDHDGKTISGLKKESNLLTVENIDFSGETFLNGIKHQHSIIVTGTTEKDVLIKGDLNVYIDAVVVGKLNLETSRNLIFRNSQDSKESKITTDSGTALTIGNNVKMIEMLDDTTVSAATKTKNDIPISVDTDKVKMLDLSMHNAESNDCNFKIGGRTVTLSSGMQRIGVLDNLSGTWLTGDIKVTNEDGESFVRGLAQDESDSYASDEYSQKNLYGDTYPLGLNGNANLGRYQEVRLPVKVKQLNVSVPTAIVFNIYADNSGDGGFIAPEYELQNDSCTYEDQVEVDGNKISFNKKEATVDVSCKGIVATSDSKNEYSIRDFSKMNKETMEQSVDHPVVCLDMTINNGTDKTIFPLDETVKTSSSTIATVIPGSNILQLARPSGYVDDNEKRYYQIPKLIEDGTTRKLAGHHTLSLGFKMD